MYAVKGGWLGQTFALATPNDSGAKKSRLRISKEDRKALVEIFIKRYQNSNSGNFPSLNLTHKEVGGSFYTVREIVREIIQENRVLGPAKLTEDEQEVDQFHEQYPLGSISKECQSHVFVSSNETYDNPKDHNGTSEELNSALSIKVDGHKQARVCSERYINSTSVDTEYKEAVAMKPSVEVIYNNLYTTPRVTSIATDVLVETFPIDSASNVTQDMNDHLVESGKFAATFKQQETKRLEAKPEPRGLVYSGPLDEKSGEHVGDPLLETSSSSTTESITISTLGSKIVQVDDAVADALTIQTTNQDLMVARTERKPAPNNIKIQDNVDSSSNCGQSLSQDAATIKIRSPNQNAIPTEERRYSTLNRTKLVSWEGLHRRSAAAENNPVLAVLKSFISKFVKFWTE